MYSTMFQLQLLLQSYINKWKSNRPARLYCIGRRHCICTDIEAIAVDNHVFSLLIRMLGSLASIIPERKNAHHSIRQSLDSHDNVEVEAAIFAAASFSAQSK